MKKYQVVFIVFLSFFWIPLSYSEETNSYKIHAEKLRQTYEPVLFTFSPVIQKHYAVRLYRMTGDERYVYPVIFHLFGLLRKLHYDKIRLNNPSYIQRRTEQIINYEFILGATNPEARRAALVKSGDVPFYLKLSQNINTLREYYLLGSKVFPESDKMIEAMRQHKDKLTAFLLDEQLMKTAGAQLVNYIYYLYRIDAIDIRKQYLVGLEKALMKGKPDSELSRSEYIDKIYGMTHVILAASDYYQQPVERKDFAWIFDFLLAKYNKENPILKKVKDRIVVDIDPNKEMILSVKGSDNLRKGEHRNVLAIMLLDWPESLTTGPNLREMKKFQKLLPIQERQ
jgi:hypothetical protein